MSCEGEIIYLCENGHMFIENLHYDRFTDLYDLPGEETKHLCPKCQTEVKFLTTIDYTNGPNCGMFDFNKILKESVKVEKCDKCGASHLIEEGKYYFPNNEELKNLQFEYCKEKCEEFKECKGII